MRLRTITCSGANEHTDIEELVELMQRYPEMEVGIQVSGKKASLGSERYWWLMRLRRVLNERWTITSTVALHLNQDWVEAFCAGTVPPEVTDWLHMKVGDSPFISRVQLNFKIGREAMSNAMVLAETIKRYPNQRFILSYNEANAEFINELHDKYQLKFDCLFDSSFGEGIAPDKRPKPAFDDVFQGYAGGLSPENVVSELKALAAIMPEDREIFIDAEGKLKGEDKHFSVEKCWQFIENAGHWDK